MKIGLRKQKSKKKRINIVLYILPTQPYIQIIPKTNKMKRSASNSNSTTVMKKKKIETIAVTCSEVTANGDSILTVMKLGTPEKQL